MRVDKPYTQQQYTELAIYCNYNNCHIEDKGDYLESVENEPYIPTIQDQIIALENTITARNIRSAIQGDEYALNKIAEVEAQIAELRKQLEESK